LLERVSGTPLTLHRRSYPHPTGPWHPELTVPFAPYSLAVLTASSMLTVLPDAWNELRIQPILRDIAPGACSDAL